MTVTTAERTAYDAWMERKNHRTAGSALLNAYLDGRRDLLEDHRNACHGGCDWCVGLRQWGECTKCGKDPVEAVGPDELSRCCLARTLLTPGDRADVEASDRILHDDPWSTR